MENIISEFRVIETDDGFRIEIKGDKEKIRPIIERIGAFGAMRWGRGFGGAWGGFGCFPPFMRHGGPRGWGWGQSPEGEGQDAPKEV